MAGDPHCSGCRNLAWGKEGSSQSGHGPSQAGAGRRGGSQADLRGKFSPAVGRVTDLLAMAQGPSVPGSSGEG